MNISLENVGRRYNADWIFKNVNYNFNTGESHVILGANGSGKSTLLKIISGALTPSEGSLVYKRKTGELLENTYQQMAIATPYLELVEEFSLQEQLQFHVKLKPFSKNVSIDDALRIMDLEAHKNKAIKQFSSGMKQRAKIAIAVLSNTTTLLLDEPTSNLDEKGISWYKELIEKYTTKKLVIVCSNSKPEEYFFCDKQIKVEEYKKTGNWEL